MPLQIYNTLTNKKDILKPMKNKQINLFVCGPTVYDYSHIGHARNYIAFDCFVKFLRDLGYKVFYLQNITDLDDKIIARAREKGVTPKDLALAFEKEYLKDMKALGINSVTKYARATNYIKEIISQIDRLLKKDFAYIIQEDGIYYDISKFENYGKLAGRTVLQADDGVSRVDYSRNKRNRGDFCIWKFRQQEEEPSWKSPWGQGRPGWHIEDTSITEKFFGPQYDIHGGARDLIFPHHEAEVSLMESISGKTPLARYWMHVGFLTVNGQKMSKSLGNFITIDDFLKRWKPNYLRFFVAKNLWRSPLDYTESAMIEVKSAVEKIEDFLRKIKNNRSPKNKSQNTKLIKNFKDNFYKELFDDFNTPKAFSVIFDFIKEANKLIEKNIISQKESTEVYKIFEGINKIFGIVDFSRVNKKIPTKVNKLIKEREICRKKQEWQKSDEIRKEIEKQGYLLEDGRDGPIVKII
jgi:cysteinyl-tRNA synthetase